MRLKQKIFLGLACFFLSANQGVYADDNAVDLQLDSTLSQEQPEELMDMQMPAMQDEVDPNESTANSDHGATHQVVNNTSLSNLSAHAWKIVGIRGAKDFHFKSDDSVFLFAKDLKFKAFLACNSIFGKYEADGAGKFLLRDLNSSHKSCNESRDQEVLIESMLLAVDGYFIDHQTLYLGSKGKPVLAFTETNKSVNAMESKRSAKTKVEVQVHGNSKKSKRSSKTEVSPKNKSQGVIKTKSQNKVKAKKKK